MRIIALAAALAAFGGPALAQTCTGQTTTIGAQPALRLSDGGLVMRGKMNINLDGWGRAYHRDNIAGGGVLHLCNAGEVFLPNGARYHGSVDNATCVGRFMTDYGRIRAANWANPAVGAIRWYGVLGQGEARIAGRRVPGVRPVEQPDSSGFYVSPTALEDRTRPATDQRRYVDPVSVPAAVVSRAAADAGARPRTFGVAIHRGAEVPFIVGDTGPRVGEGTSALARGVAGLPLEPVTRQNRYAGAVDRPTVLWVFFGGSPATAPYDAASVRQRAAEAFARWGGAARLRACGTAMRP